MSSYECNSKNYLTYTEVGERVSKYLNDGDLVCTINYRIQEHDADCKLYIDMINIEPKYRNQKLSKPILLDFINRKHIKPVCLENRIGTVQFPFPDGATPQTQSALRNLYSSIGFKRKSDVTDPRHPDFNDMILTGRGKRLKPRNKRSKSKNKRSKTKKRCINKKNYKSKKRS